MRIENQWNPIEIQYALFQWLRLRSRLLVLTNIIPWYWYECDLFSITKALYFHEVEVKVSRSDFYADFRKHGKHETLAQKDGHKRLMPRTFCFACPADLLVSEDIPEYTGLIWVNRKESTYPEGFPQYSVEVMVKPPALPALKMSAEQVSRIASNLWWRYANTWERMAQAQIEQLMATAVSS